MGQARISRFKGSNCVVLEEVWAVAVLDSFDDHHAFLRDPTLRYAREVTSFKRVEALCRIARASILLDYVDKQNGFRFVSFVSSLVCIRLFFCDQNWCARSMRALACRTHVPCRVTATALESRASFTPSSNARSLSATPQPFILQLQQKQKQAHQAQQQAQKVQPQQLVHTQAETQSPTIPTPPQDPHLPPPNCLKLKSKLHLDP